MPNDFLEKTLEEIIFENRDKVHGRGFPNFLANAKRQFIMPIYGTCDIFSWEISEKSFKGKIFELKKDKVDINTLSQVIGYGKQLDAILINRFQNIDISLYAIGNEIDTNVLNLAYWGLNVHIYTYDYSFDGLVFEKVGNLNTPHKLSDPKAIYEDIDSYYESFIKRVTV